MAGDGGISNLSKKMRAITKAVKESVQPALNKSAEEMAASMRQLAESSKDSGDLIDSIAVTTAGNRTPAYSQPGGSYTVPENAAVITVGNAQVRYPHLVEYGTLKAPAQPFFWPAYRLNKKRAQNRIKRAVNKAVKDNWGK